MRVVLQGEPPFVWLTAEGMRTAGQNLPGAEPSVATLNHNRIVTDIRIHLLSHITHHMAQRANDSALCCPEGRKANTNRTCQTANCSGKRFGHLR